MADATAAAANKHQPEYLTGGQSELQLVPVWVRQERVVGSDYKCAYSAVTIDRSGNENTKNL